MVLELFFLVLQEQDAVSQPLFLKAIAPTRFFSWFVMMERMFQMKKYVDVVCENFSNIKGCPTTLTQQEWELVGYFIKIVKPLYRVSIILQSHNTPSGIHTAPLVSQLLLMYRVLIPELTDATMSNFAGEQCTQLSDSMWSKLANDLKNDGMEEILEFVRHIWAGEHKLVEFLSAL